MRSGTIALLLGVILLHQVKQLPDALWCLLLVPLLPLIFIVSPVFRVTLCISCGFLWALFFSSAILSKNLHESLEREDVVVEGYISSLPQIRKRSTQFEFDVIDISFQGEPQRTPGKVLLNWYGKPPSLYTGDKWRFVVRLKRPHGFMNPGGFDYEGWLFQKEIRAKGYVRESDINKRLSSSLWSYPLQRFRHYLADFISTTLKGSPYAGIVIALAIGERQYITQQQWQVLTDTGTNHLMAISGLHVGMVSALLFFSARYFWSKSGRLSLYLPAPKAAAIASISGAFAYAALAGFSVPTQRALIMLLVVMLCIIWQRQQKASEVLSLSLLAVLLFDPNAVLSAGFWLSFGAVSVILFAMAGRIGKPSMWQKWGYIHIVAGLGLAPLLLLLFQKVALLSPVANFIAVPLVSIITVPLTLLGTAIISVAPFVGSFLLGLAEFSLALVWPYLEFIASIDMLLWSQHQPPLWSIAVGVVGVLWLFVPKGFPGRWLGFIWLLPLILVKPKLPEDGEIWFTVLDVGQGLAAVVRTENHTLIYDLGPRFNKRFDTGKAVIVPFLKSQGVKKVDTIVVSHADNDHIGGLDSVLSEFQTGKILTSRPDRVVFERVEQCVAGQEWRWDDISFSIIHPDNPDLFSKNDASCVLVIENSAGYRIMLAGDIEKAAENHLLQNYAARLPAQILVAPHHGSNTSSTREFIDAVGPEYVVFTVGYKNRWGFPKENILKRYEDINAKIFNSALNGAVIFKIKLQENSIETYRQSSRRYWHWQDN